MENDDSIEADRPSSQGSQNYHNKITNFLSPLYYQHNQVNQRQKCGEISGFGQFGNEIGVINRLASGISCVPGGGGEVSGKVLFTVTQWQELERQMMIFKYIMASIPVPPHLLIPLSTQSNKELRFSSGSDPEPWRCRRTDGKKWRCSRDVAPEQKYCERHAHKNRPRSRKLVEIQSSSSSYQHPRSTEWFMKSGAGAVSSSKSSVSSSSGLQFQQSMNSQCSHSHSHSHSHSYSYSHTPAVGSKRTHFLPQENLQLDSAGARRQQFIDAWSKAGDGDNCSLTLSMQCSGGFDGNDDRGFDIGSAADVLRSHSQWSNSNHGLGMGSPPGGPLGEALGLGIASTVIGPRPSTHGGTGSASDDGASHGHELSFIM